MNSSPLAPSRLWAIRVQCSLLLSPPLMDVVVVRQTEVVAELVEEDAPAAVLRLDGVVADPDAGVADLGAAELVGRRAGGAVLEGVPAVAPDRVLALVRVAVGLVAAGVDDLEVVDVAVGLVEVAVAVEVVAVPLVEGRQLGLDLARRAAGGDLVVVPLVGGVPDELPRCWSRRCRRTGSRWTGRSGPRCTHLDPVGHRAVDAEPAGRLLLVVGLERLRALPVPKYVFWKWCAVVVRLPDGGVVHRRGRARGSRCAADRRSASGRAWPGRCPGRGSSGDARCRTPRGSRRRGRWTAWPPRRTAAGLRPLSLAPRPKSPPSLTTVLLAALLGGGLPVEHLADRFLAQRATLVLERVGELILGDRPAAPRIFEAAPCVLVLRRCRDCRRAQGEAEPGSQHGAEHSH